MKKLAIGLRILAAVLLPVAILLSHRNTTVVFGLIALSGITVLWRTKFQTWMIVLIGALAYMALTTLWSPYEKAMTWPLNLLVLAVGTIAGLQTRDELSGKVFLWSAAITVLLIGFEAATGGLIRDITPPEHYADRDDVATARGITIMVSIFPAVILWAWLTRRPLFGGVLSIAMVWAATSFGLFANALALFAGAGMAGFAVWRPKLTIHLMMAGGAFGFLFFPLFVSGLPPVETLLEFEQGPLSWRVRLVAWKVLWQEYLSQDMVYLLFGNGIESIRVLGKSLGTMPIVGILAPIDMIPTHPHNVYLQIWYEFGIVGVAFALFSLWFGYQKMLIIRSKDIVMAVCAIGGATIIFASVDASLWTQWRIIAPIIGAWLAITAKIYCDANKAA